MTGLIIDLRVRPVDTATSVQIEAEGEGYERVYGSVRLLARSWPSAGS